MKNSKVKKPLSKAALIKKIKDSLPTTSIGSLTSITVEIDYPYVTGNHAVRHGQRAHKTNPKASAYYARVANQVRRAGLALRLAGPLKVHFDLFPPSLTARDADNAMKVLKDSLTKAEFWVDDSNKVIRAGSWEWGVRAEDEPAKVVVTVRGYEP